MTKPVTWELTDRGPRVVLHVGGEEIWTTLERARAVRDGIDAVLLELLGPMLEPPRRALRHLERPEGAVSLPHSAEQVPEPGASAIAPAGDERPDAEAVVVGTVPSRREVAAMIRAVREAPFDRDQPLLDLADQDLAVLQLICEIIPEGVLDLLEMDGSPSVGSDMSNHLDGWYCRECNVTITEPDTPTEHFLRVHKGRAAADVAPEPTVAELTALLDRAYEYMRADVMSAEEVDGDPPELDDARKWMVDYRRMTRGGR